MDGGEQVNKGVRIRSLFSEANNSGKEPAVPTSKPPGMCVLWRKPRSVELQTFPDYGTERAMECRKGINEFFLVAWQVIVKEELVLWLNLVTFMVVKEIITTYYMALQGVT